MIEMYLRFAKKISDKHFLRRNIQICWCHASIACWLILRAYHFLMFKPHNFNLWSINITTFLTRRSYRAFVFSIAVIFIAAPLEKQMLINFNCFFSISLSISTGQIYAGIMRFYCTVITNIKQSFTGDYV